MRLSRNFWFAMLVIFTTNAASLSLGAFFGYFEGVEVGRKEGFDAGHADGIAIGIKAGLETRQQ